MFSYTVRCEFKERDIANAWLQWLNSEHIQDVINAGATAAEVFEMQADSSYEIRYQFESKQAFETYEREHAPRLREEGLDKFPLELGLAYSRSCGQSIIRFEC